MSSDFSKPPISFLMTIFLLTALEFLQSGMVAFAASPIMGQIGAAPEEYSIATASYACVAIITISKQRWLVERLGWRQFIQYSLTFFILGSMVCAGSDAYLQFLIGRCIMGLGGAAFMTSGRIIVNLIPPSPMRFYGIKVFASGLACGIAFAPGAASLAVITDYWNTIFFILSAVAFLTIICASLSLSSDLTSKELRSQSNPVLFIVLISGSFLLLYILQRLQYDFFSDLNWLVVGMGVSVLAFYYYFRSMYHHKQPLLALKELKQPRYIMGVCLFTLCYILLGANNYMLPYFIQRNLGFPWQIVGQLQSLGLLSALGAWFVMAWMLPKWPNAKKYFVVGFFALASFGWQLSRLSSDANLWIDILPAIICNGLFLMLVMATTAMQSFRDLQHNEALFSNAQQLKNMVAQFGLALGITLATISMQWRTSEHYAVLNNRINGSDPSYILSIKLLTQSVGQQIVNPSVGILLRQLEQQATQLACLDYFLAIAWIGILGAAMMSVQRVMK